MLRVGLLAGLPHWNRLPEHVHISGMAGGRSDREHDSGPLEEPAPAVRLALSAQAGGAVDVDLLDVHVKDSFGCPPDRARCDSVIATGAHAPPLAPH